MLCCYRCGKSIMGKAVHYTPSNVAIKLGADFPKGFI